MIKQEVSKEELKQIELNILKRFDKICRDNHLEYSLAFGTMLGAVRHKGFIPWDDDIDVFMKRKDYEKLLSLKYEDNDYEIKSYRYSKNYYYPFSKMSDKRTEIIESWRAEKNLGIYIDIFPLDYINEDDPQKLDKIKKKAEKANNIAYIMGHKLSHHKSFSIRYITKLLLLISTYPIKKQIIKRADLLNAKEKQGKYLAMLLQTGEGAKPFIESKYYNKIIYMDFENFKAPVFEEYDHLLTMIYGDYMTPPPVEKQISGHWFKAYRK